MVRQLTAPAPSAPLASDYDSYYSDDETEAAPVMSLGSLSQRIKQLEQETRIDDLLQVQELLTRKIERLETIREDLVDPSDNELVLTRRMDKLAHKMEHQEANHSGLYDYARRLDKVYAERIEELEKKADRRKSKYDEMKGWVKQLIRQNKPAKPAEWFIDIENRLNSFVFKLQEARQACYDDVVHAGSSDGLHHIEGRNQKHMIFEQCMSHLVNDVGREAVDKNRLLAQEYCDIYVRIKSDRCITDAKTGLRQRMDQIFKTLKNYRKTR
jgi:hypothetical protein